MSEEVGSSSNELTEEQRQKQIQEIAKKQAMEANKLEVLKNWKLGH